ncbi:MAG: hypothetical protein ACKOAX_09065, partial [Candidatus Kapaibacterium sp.]
MVFALDGDGTSSGAATDASTDPYLWLEDVDGRRAMTFVEGQNAIVKQRLRATSEDAAMYDAVFAKSMETYNSTDRIAYPRPL